MDLSQLSDAQLDQMHQQALQRPQGRDLSQLSDAQLDQMHQQALGSQAPAQAAGPDGSPIVQEQHPDVSFGDRLIAKNFGTDATQQAAYIQQQHPNLKVSQGQDGRVIVKRPEEKQWRTLAPDNGFHPIDDPYEALKTLGGQAVNIGSGLVSGLASAAGGVAGAAASPYALGLGALPAGMAAGAATNAGLETAKQAIGSALGMPDNYNKTDIGMAGLTGLAAPLLFGTGGTAAQLAEKGLTGEALSTALKSQSGLPMQAFRSGMERFGPNVGGLLSGTGASAVKDLQSSLPQAVALDANPAAAQELAKDTIEDTGKKFSQKIGSLSKKLKEHISNLSGDEGIDITESAAPWRDKIDELAKAAEEPNAPDFVKQQLAAVKKQYVKLFGSEEAENFTKQSPESVSRIQKYLQEIADFKEGPRVHTGAPVNPTDSTIAQLAKDSYGGLNRSIEESAPGAQKIRDSIHEFIQKRNAIDTQVGDAKNFVSRMERNSSNKLNSRSVKELFLNTDKELGTKLDSTRAALNAAQVFSKSNPLISASLRRIPGAVAGGIAGYGAGRETGISPWAGMLGGTVAGSLLTGPRALRALTELSQNSGGNALTAFPRATSTPIWNMLRSKSAQGD